VCAKPNQVQNKKTDRRPWPFPTPAPKRKQVLEYEVPFHGKGKTFGNWSLARSQPDRSLINGSLVSKKQMQVGILGQTYS